MNETNCNCFTDCAGRKFHAVGCPYGIAIQLASRAAQVSASLDDQIAARIAALPDEALHVIWGATWEELRPRLLDLLAHGRLGAPA